jgi:hypothetical protein
VLACASRIAKDQNVTLSDGSELLRRRRRLRDLAQPHGLDRDPAAGAAGLFVDPAAAFRRRRPLRRLGRLGRRVRRFRRRFGGFGGGGGGGSFEASAADRAAAAVAAANGSLPRVEIDPEPRRKTEAWLADHDRGGRGAG